MINRFFKTIHNKYSRFFKFIFFLRYLLAIFFISIILFLSIPNFFNYEKKVEVIKNYLLKNYNFEVEKYETIQFTGLPLPRLEFKNAEINLEKSSVKLSVKNLKIYPKFFSIYNYKNFKTNKIVLEDNNIALEISDLKYLKKNLLNQKKKLYINNLDLKINNESTFIIILKKINFSNFGYKKDIISGLVFDKRFKITSSENFNNINFKLHNSGISADINFNKIKRKDLIEGVFKSKILKTNLKFNFDYNNKVLKISNSNFRSKNISFSNENVIIFKPFLDVSSKFVIKEIKTKILKKIDLNKLFESKNIIKKINTKNEIIFKSKKFSRSSLIDELKLKIDLSYGRITYLKRFFISDSFFKCAGNVNLLQESPLLFFDCSIVSNNKKKLLKKFLINTKEKNENFELQIKGNLNILNKKINLTKIYMNKNYKATNEDLKFFKNTFENILFDKSFLEIFSYEKIKRFILEIS